MDTVQQGRAKFGLFVLVLSLAPMTCVAAQPASVSGMVRDAQGVAQIGAMVQVLAADSATVATSFTDIYGRYRIAGLAPGRYQVRATAALFIPAVRGDLRLATGTRATVNLTLSMLSDAIAWLPAERRKPDEPSDDWAWTLRSVVNRPILRMLSNGELVMVEDGQEQARPAVTVHTTVAGNCGGFGEGGVGNTVVLDRKTGNGSNMVVRTAFAAGQGGVASSEMDAGYERKLGFAGESRMAVSYVSRPEMVGAGDAVGMQVLRMASAEKMRLGDTLDMEAGGTVYAVHTSGNAIAMQPFLRVTVHPGQVWAVRYSLATEREMQGFDGLDSVAAGVPMVAEQEGHLQVASGRHQEISLTRRFGTHGATIQAALYHDAMDRTVVAGQGALGAADLPAASESIGLMEDTATGSFQFVGRGYTTNGTSITVSEPLTPSLWAMLAYENGAALASGNVIAMRLPEVSSGLHVEDAEAATVALKGRVMSTGTKMQVAYRWQPGNMVTAVGPYEAFNDQGYLSFYIRQALRWGNKLPPGLEATVDVTNLLAEGYRPFLSADGHTLYLAQAPRTMQAGLSFTF